MSWLFSLALVEEYLGDISLDGEQSVQLNGKPTQQAYCAPGKMTDFYRVSQFGMMFKPLMESLGEELLMSYQADFHAKTYPQQEGGGELKQSDQECGKKWRESLAKLDQDTLLWKIPQCSLLEDSEQSLQTWPNWGLMLNGECFRQPMLVQTTKENEFGYWLTPNCMDSLPPRSIEALKKQYDKNRQGRTTHSTLREQVVYPPPNQMWPTPSTRDYKGGYLGGRIRNGKVSWDTLDVAVQHTDNQNKDGGQLNPMWVEWLMGWPVGWTELKPLEMDKFPFVQQQHGNC